MPPIAVESQYTAIVSKKHNVIFCYVDVPVLPSTLVVKGGERSYDRDFSI